MEVIRKRNQATKIVFPLINATSTSAYYTTSAWTSMTNATKNVYFWSDDVNAPTSATIAANPTQLDGYGLWYLVISASEISASSQYMSIKLKSDQILEQTILVRITNYDQSNIFTSSDLIKGNSTSVTVSAYQNFPQVYVSAGQVTNVTGNISGSVNSVVGGVTVTTNNDKTGYSVTAQTNHPTVGVSAYTNFPQVYVSANGDKTGYSITANSDKSGYSITANTDKTGYILSGPVSVSAYTNFPQVYVSAGQVTNVTGNVSGSVNNVIVPQSVTIGSVNVSGINSGLFVGTSAYTNFPQVYVSAGTVTASSVTDKTGYSITANSDKSGYSLAGSVGVSAYTNFPQVYVSAGQVTNVTGNVSGSVNSVVGNVGGNVVGSVGSVTGNVGGNVVGSVASVTNSVSVSAQTNHPVVSVSAYTNFPQVYVSAGQVTNVTGNVSGSVNSVVVPQSVTVGSVNVSGINGGLFVGTSAYTNFPQVQVSGLNSSVITSSSIANGALVSADFQNDYWNRVSSLQLTTVGVSAYQNFPQVYVSAGQVTNVTGNISGSVNSVVGGVTVTTNNDKTGYSVTAQTNHPTVAVSAYSNFPQVQVSSTTIPLSADVRQWIGTSPNILQSGRVDAYVGNKGVLNDLGLTQLSAVTATSVSDKTGYSITANSDKTNYTVSSGSITAVAGNVTGSVASVTNPVSVSSTSVILSANVAQWLGTTPNVLISGRVDANAQVVGDKTGYSITANSDKTNYTVSSGTVNTITNSVIVSAYQNFPQVQVSGMNSGTITSAVIANGSIISADFQNDYWNRTGIGTPVSLNGGTATIAGMLQQMSDGDAGVSFISASSLRGIYNQIINNNAAALTANGGSVLGGSNLSGSYLNTSAVDDNYWRIQTSGTVPLSATLTFNLGVRVPSTVTIAGYLQAGVPTGAGRVDVYAYNYTTSAYTLLTNASTAILNGASNSTYSYVLNATTNVNSVGAAQLLFVAARLNTNDKLLLDYVTMNAVAAGTSVTDIANAVYNKMGLVVYDNGVWIDTLSGYTGNTLGVNGISTYPSNNLADALSIAQQINLKRFYLKPDSSIVLTSAYDAWRFIGRAIIGLNGQSISDAIFEDVEWISGTSVGQDYVMDDCAIGNVTLDSGSIHNSEFNGTFTTCANGVYVFKRCIDANPAGLSSPTFVCAPSATLGIRDYRGGIQFNNMTSSNSIKLDGMGRVVIDSSCSGGDLTLRGFWQVTNNGTGVIITSSARYDNTAPVTVSAYTNFPQVYVSAGTITNITNSVSVSAQTNHPVVSVSAYTNFPQVTVSANLDKVNYTVSSGSITAVAGNVTGSVASVTNPVSVNSIAGGVYVGTSAYTNFPQVYVSANGDKTGYSITAQTNHPSYPAMSVSAVTDKTGYSITANTDKNGYSLVGSVGVSAYTNFPQVTVSANLDKVNYTVSSGSITTVTGNVNGSVASVTNPVTVGTNNDKTGYTVTAGTIGNVTNPVSVSAYTNFPQVYVSAGQITNVTGNVSGSVNNVVVPQSVTVGSVNVSSVDSGAITSSDFNSDVYNQINIVLTSNHGEGSWQSTSGSSVISANVVQWKGLTPNDLIGGKVDANATASATVSVGSVNVSSVNAGVFVGTSAYTNFPQVTVSANLDKVNYTVSSGSITAVAGNVNGSVASVTNPVSVNSIAGGVYVGTSAYTNFPQVYVSAGQVTNVTGNVSGSVNSVVGGVTVTTNNDKTGYSVTAQTNHPTVAVSAYSNFPQVYVSAGTVTASSVTDKTGYSITANTDKTGYSLSGPVSVSAYTNFPQVTVSANLDKVNYTVLSGTITTVTGNVNGSVASVTNPVIVGTNNDKTGYSITANTDKTGYSIAGSVGVSAYTNFPQVTVSANLDKVNYTVSSGSITTVTGNVNGSVTSVTNPVSVSAQTNHPVVSVSAYTNFPQVTVSANLDKTNYTVSSGSITTVTGNVNGSVASVTNPVIVNTYQNFPSVNVSSINNGSITSADFDSDYYNKVQLLTPTVTIGKVQVSGIDSGVYVGTSAYTNFPQVYVSAGQVTNVTGNVSGSVHNVIVSSPVSVGSVNVSSVNTGVFVGTSAYTNFPQVYVSAIAPGVDISATVTLDYNKVMSAAISAIDQKFTFTSGGNLIVDTDSIVNAIMVSTIDTKTFEEVVEILLAMATGRITRSNNLFTYYKQNNSTQLYTLESERSERNRI